MPWTPGSTMVIAGGLRYNLAILQGQAVETGEMLGDAMNHPENEPDTELLDPEEWVDAFGDRFYRYAMARLNDVEAAEEVIQETFLAGIRNQHAYTGSGTQVGWLITILRRKIVDWIRRRNQTLEQSWGGEHDPTALLFDEKGNWRPNVLPSIEPGLDLEKGELWQVVQSCLGNLPQIQADVFVLNVIEGMNTKEICKVLDITPSNMWVRLHRARLSLAKCVGTKWFEDSISISGSSRNS